MTILSFENQNLPFVDRIEGENLKPLFNIALKQLKQCEDSLEWEIGENEKRKWRESQE